MPFIRSVSAAFVLVFLGLAAFRGGSQPWFDQEILRLSLAVAGATFLLATRRGLFSGLTTLFVAGYFLQRIFVLYFWPDQLLYTEHLSIVPDDLRKSLGFAALGILAVWAGTFAASRRARRTAIAPEPMRPDETVDVLGLRVPFVGLFKMYALGLAVPGIALQLVLIVNERIGVGGLSIQGPIATVYRLSMVFQSLNAIAFLPLLTRGMDRSVKRLALVLIVLQLVLGVASTSKGVFITQFLSFIVCLHYAGRRIAPRYAAYGAAIGLTVVLVFAPITHVVRGSILSGEGWTEAIQELWDAPLVLPTDRFLVFSQRLGGLDWLIGAVNVGRDAFPGYVGLAGDLSGIAHSLVPKEIWPKPDNPMLSGALMAHLMRGTPLEVADGARMQGDILGIFGMAFVYFGWLGGIVFLGLWSALSTAFLSSNAGRVYKVLYVQNFVVSFFAGGALVNCVVWEYQALLLIFLLAMLMTTLKRKAV